MAANLDKKVKQNTEYLQPLGTPLSASAPGKMPVANDGKDGFGTKYEDIGDVSKEKAALDKAVRKAS